MAFWKEVTGKTRSKTLLIGDGVDKVHSPLQVEPQMATDMLNISSKLFPALSIREQSALDNITTFYANELSGDIVCVCDPFRDSGNNIHLAVLVFYPDGIFFPLLKDMVRWFILRDGETDFEYLTTLSPQFHGEATTYFTETGLGPDQTNKFATGNFCEIFGKVYFSFSATSRTTGLTTVYGLSYEISTEAEDLPIEEVYDMRVPRLNPICSYLNRLFIGVDNQIKYSALSEPEDFTTAYDSGSLPLTQGGVITSLTPMRDRLLVSTENSLFALFGSDFDTFSLSLVTDTLGILNPKCITEYNGIVYFIGSDGDVYEYTGNSLTNITREPTQTGSKSGVKGGFDQIDIGFSQITYYNNRLYILVEPDISTDDENINIDTYVFDVVKRRWYINNHQFAVEAVDPQAQIETATIVGTITTGGTVALTLTAESVNGGTPYSFDVTVSLGDNAETVAGKIRIAMDADPIINAEYTISGATDKIIMTSKTAGVHDDTLNLAYANGGCAGLTADSTSTNTQKSYTFVIGPRTMLMIGGNSQTLVTYSTRKYYPYTSPTSNKATIGTYTTSDSNTVSSDTEFKWVSPAYQLNPTGRQALKAIHFTYYSPADSEIDVFVSNSVDGIDDFVNVATLHSSANKQNSRQVIGIRNTPMAEWVRIKLEGHGDIIIYNMTLEWRLLDRLM